MRFTDRIQTKWRKSIQTIWKAIGRGTINQNIETKINVVKGAEQMDIKKILSLVGCLAELYKILSEEDI